MKVSPYDTKVKKELDAAFYTNEKTIIEALEDLYEKIQLLSQHHV